MVLNFGASFIDFMFYNASMFIDRWNGNNNNISVLFIVCIADHY